MSPRKGFTLVELLVVIAIIGVLVALLLPAVQAAREAARRTECSNNLKQLGLAMHNHHDTFGQLPPGWSGATPEGAPGWGWAAESLKFIEQSTLSDIIDFQQSTSASANAVARQTSVPFFLCPTDPGGADTFDDLGVTVARANYVGVFGSEEIEDDPSNGDGVLYHNSQTRFADITDGLSNTFMVGERSSQLEKSTWVGVISGGDEAMARIVGSADHTPNSPSAHFDDFSSLHPGGTMFLLSDGSVRFIPETIDHAVYVGAATRGGGEINRLDQ